MQISRQANKQASQAQWIKEWLMFVFEVRWHHHLRSSFDRSQNPESRMCSWLFWLFWFLAFFNWNSFLTQKWNVVDDFVWKIERIDESCGFWLRFFSLNIKKKNKKSIESVTVLKKTGFFLFIFKLKIFNPDFKKKNWKRQTLHQQRRNSKKLTGKILQNFLKNIFRATWTVWIYIIIIIQPFAHRQEC